MKRAIMGILLALTITTASATPTMWTLPVPICWANGQYTIKLSGAMIGSTDTVKIENIGYQQIVHVTATDQLVLVPQPDRFTPVDVTFYNSNGSVSECVTNSNVCPSLPFANVEALYTKDKNDITVNIKIQDPSAVREMHIINRSTKQVYQSIEAKLTDKVYSFTLKQ